MKFLQKFLALIAILTLSVPSLVQASEETVPGMIPEDASWLYQHVIKNGAMVHTINEAYSYEKSYRMEVFQGYHIDGEQSRCLDTIIEAHIDYESSLKTLVFDAWCNLPIDLGNAKLFIQHNKERPLSSADIFVFGQFRVVLDPKTGNAIVGSTPWVTIGSLKYRVKENVASEILKKSGAFIVSEQKKYIRQRNQENITQ